MLCFSAGNGDVITLDTNRSIIPPCMNCENDFTWTKTYSATLDLTKVEGCCNVFKTVFDQANIQQIMKIMMHTIGSPLPFGRLNENGMVDRNTGIKTLPNQGAVLNLIDLWYRHFFQIISNRYPFPWVSLCFFARHRFSLLGFEKCRTP